MQDLTVKEYRGICQVIVDTVTHYQTDMDQIRDLCQVNAPPANGETLATFQQHLLAREQARELQWQDTEIWKYLAQQFGLD